MDQSQQRNMLQVLPIERILLPILSHELRTPLTAIKGFMELLLRYRSQLDDGEQGAVLQEAMLASTQLEGIIDQICELAALIIGAHQLTLVPLDLALILKEANTIVAAQLSSQRVNVVSHDFSEHDAMVAGDAVLLSRLFAQVLQRVVHDVLPDAPITINLHPAPVQALPLAQAATLTQWEIQIHTPDGGRFAAQFADVFLPHADDRLWREPGSFDLTYWRLITTLHGGTMTVQRTDQGSTFSLRLPAHIASNVALA